MNSLRSRLSVAAVSVLSIVVFAAAPVSAQNANAMQQLCTGTKANFKCAPVDSSVPVSTINDYLQGKGNAANQAALDQQIKNFKDTLNKGNGAPNNSGWQGLEFGQGNSKAPDLTEIKQKADEYLAKRGNGNSSANNGNSGASTGNGSSTSPGNQGNGNGNTGTPTGSGSNNQGNGGTGNSNNPGNGGSGTQTVADRCAKIQDTVNDRIGKLNTRAQASLASMDDTLKKLQDYQSTIDPSQLPADYQTLVQQALDAQDKSTTAVATMAALNVKVDCTQPNPAQSLSVIKSSADTTRTQLQDFAKSIQTLANDLAKKAQP